MRQCTYVVWMNGVRVRLRSRFMFENSEKIQHKKGEEERKNLEKKWIEMIVVKELARTFQQNSLSWFRWNQTNAKISTFQTIFVFSFDRRRSNQLIDSKAINNNVRNFKCFYIYINVFFWIMCWGNAPVRQPNAHSCIFD